MIVATITPSIGIDQVTTFIARVEVTDPDGDLVSVALTSLCPFQKDTPVELNGGVGVISIKPVEKCGPTLSFMATDSKGATARADVSAGHRGLTGSFRLVIGDGFYGEPHYSITLAQSGTLITGTLSDYPRSGVMDLQTPGSIDENGRFRLRFRVQTDPEEFVLSGELIASNEISLGDRVMATGQVVSGRHAGRAFTIWVPAYALSPPLLARSLSFGRSDLRAIPYPLHQISPSDIGSGRVTYYQKRVAGVRRTISRYQFPGRSKVPSGFHSQLPARCKFCNALGTVTPEMTIIHGVTVRTWCCRACRKEWPLTPGEIRAVERRQALSSRSSRAGQQRRSNSG